MTDDHEIEHKWLETVFYKHNITALFQDSGEYDIITEGGKVDDKVV